MNFFLSFTILTLIIFSSNCTRDQELLHLEIKTWHKKQESAAELAQIKILNQRDVQYLVELQIGSNNQSYQLTIDTGSSDFLLSSSKCETCETSQKFACKKSITCKQKTDEIYNLNYGDGLVEAHIVYDDIKFGNMISKHQSFLLADYAEGEISLGPEILGVGPDEHNIFSIYLSSNYQAGSALILGGYKTQYFQNSNETIHWFPLISILSFEIQFDGIEIFDTFIKMDYQNAILDTGSSAMTFPNAEIQKIIQLLAQFEFSCSIDIEEYNTNYGMLSCQAGRETAEFPEIIFSFSNKKFVMKPEDYIYFCKFNSELDTYSCLTKLEACFSEEAIVVLGDGFMQTFYTIFDKENQKIGIVRSKNVNKISLTLDGEEIVPLEKIKKVRAEKNFTKKSKVVVLGGMLSIPFFVMLLSMMRRKQFIKINQNQLAVAFGGIFLAASFCLCFYMTIQVNSK